MKLIWPILTLCLALPACAGDEEVVAGPAAVNVGARGATVVWLVKEAQSTMGESPADHTLAAQSLGVRLPSQQGSRIAYSRKLVRLVLKAMQAMAPSPAREREKRYRFS